MAWISEGWLVKILTSRIVTPARQALDLGDSVWERTLQFWGYRSQLLCMLAVSLLVNLQFKGLKLEMFSLSSFNYEEVG